MDVDVNQDKNGEADGMNLEVDSKDEVMQYDYYYIIIIISERLIEKVKLPSVINYQPRCRYLVLSVCLYVSNLKSGSGDMLYN